MRFYGKACRTWKAVADLPLKGTRQVWLLAQTGLLFYSHSQRTAASL